ncbi:hypothetical protein LCGC14_2673000 [marine sediment metagenome]|uniref:Uncharacterized protein n=1 Tax=marine sediment metagenome TaxID=412755 RepID=A0A0F8ZNK4_9ZZZZ
MSEADALIGRLFAIADTLDESTSPPLQGIRARLLAEDFEEYFILYGKPDARAPKGITNATDCTLQSEAMDVIRQQDRTRDALKAILDESSNGP